MILITGVPVSGKSIFTDELSRRGKRVFHTDEFMTLLPHNERTRPATALRHWSIVSEEVSFLIDDTGNWDVIAGNAVVRAMRKWLQRKKTGTPADVVLWFGTPLSRLTMGQRRTATTCTVVWSKILRQLLDRGQRIVYPDIAAIKAARDISQEAFGDMIDSYIE